MHAGKLGYLWLFIFTGLMRTINLSVEEYTAYYQEMFSYAKALIVVSRKMEEQLLALGAFREKVHYNVCGVDTDLFRDRTSR